MFYSGLQNVPGAPGNLMGQNVPMPLGQPGVPLAGSPGYFMQDKEIQDRLFRYGMDNTPAGQELKQKMQNFRNQYPQIFGSQLRQV
jgi:hypothetical protein